MTSHRPWRIRVLALLAALLFFAVGIHPGAAHAASGSVIANHEPLKNVLIELGKSFNVNVVLLQDFDIPISATLRDVTLADALKAILGTRGIHYTVSGKLVVIGEQTATPAARSDSDVVILTNVAAKSVLSMLRGSLPQLHATLGPTPNVLLLRGTPDDLNAARRFVTAVDVPDPTKDVSAALVLQHADARTVAAGLQRLFPRGHFFAATNRTLLMEAPATLLDQAKAVASTLDVAPPAKATPGAATAKSVQAFSVVQGRPQDVARTVGQALPTLKASVSGAGQVVVAGPSTDVARAQQMIAQIDRPLVSDRYVAIYRLRNVDARSVGDLIARTFRDVTVTPDISLNSLAISATAGEHQRIADAIAQLDGGASATATGGAGLPPVSQAGSDVAAGTADVITLKAAVPGLNGAAPTSATDIATAVGQALAQSAPDLHITVPANATQLVLTGSQNSIRQAKDLIDKLDTLQKLVVLDTEIYEVDESTAKTLGLRFISPILSTTYTETTPTAPASGGVAPPLLGLQQLSRTPLTLGAQLDLALSTGKAKIVADPRLTTISGRTASLRAGENLAVQTQVGGGQGTVATTQIQTFQTGVTLDITPVINEGDYISVTLHPTVNSNTGLVAGIPQISTRDTQTTVAMHEGQTLFIGGLIEESTTRNETKIPVLGDLPVIGRIFRDTDLSYSRNELVITVTPHIIDPLDPKSIPSPPPIGDQPKPAAFPTIPPSTMLPTPRPRAAALATPAPPATAGPPATPSPAAPTVANSGGNVSLPSGETPGAPTSPAPAAAGSSPPPNTFAYGQKPASPPSSSTTDPPQIVYALLTPTSFRSSASLHVEATTSTNVSRMTIGYNGFLAPISATTPGSWLSNFSFINSGLGQLPQSVSLILTAYRQDGAQVTLQIPVTVTP